MFNNEIKVSVILPVYNVEQFLEQCLDSIVNQTLREIEIICIDDGSTDNSLNILKHYAQEDARITVLQQKNAGAGAARNKGLEVAQGKYLSFLDSDDFFEPLMLEKAYCEAEKREVDFIVFRCNQYDNQEKIFKNMDWTIRKYLLPKQEIFFYQDIDHDIFRLFNGWAWDKLYRKSFVDAHNLTFQEIRTSNDVYFVFSALIKAKRISTLEDILVHQRVNVQNSLSRTREKSWDCCYRAIIALRNEFISMGIYESIERSFINWVLNFSLWHVKTLEGTAKDDLIKMLNEKCFVELDFSKFPKEYFYNEAEYEQYLLLQKQFTQYKQNSFNICVDYLKNYEMINIIKKICKKLK